MKWLEGDDHLLGLAAIEALWAAETECNELVRLHASLIESVRQLVMHHVNPVVWTDRGITSESPGRLPDGAEQFTKVECELLTTAGRALIRMDREVEGLEERRRDQLGRTGAQIVAIGGVEPKPEPTSAPVAQDRPVAKARGARLVRSA
jgi:hypothetical protein